MKALRTERHEGLSGEFFWIKKSRYQREVRFENFAVDMSRGGRWPLHLQYPCLYGCIWVRGRCRLYNCLRRFCPRRSFMCCCFACDFVLELEMFRVRCACVLVSEVET